MNADVVTVASKELREIFSRGGPRRGGRGLVGTILFPVLIGLLLGAQAGRAHNDFARGFAVFPVAFLAMGSAAGLVTDSVAGERERHTLETLLASPVSDAAILAGKLLAVVGYAWALAMVQLVAVGLASAAVGRAVPATSLIMVAILALLEAMMAAGFGVQFSLHAPTVRAASRKQAQYSIILTWVATGVNILAVSPVHGLLRLAVLLVALTALVLADFALLALARLRFRRGRLLLD